ncbi:MAG: patatin-like phospholipase family protein [Pseudomonadales bacterium]
MNDRSELRIGLALGSGSSRGFSHIGIINELAAHGVVPDVVCGASVGAMIGASLVTGRLEALEDWARKITRLQAARFLDIDAGLTGFVDLERFNDFLDTYVAVEGEVIEDRELIYGTLATDLYTAREVWMTEGPLKMAVWTSMALPGLFPPKKHQGKWLMDGGLVNPVPVSLCRAMGANFIIAVNLNGDIVGKHFETTHKKQSDNRSGITGRISSFAREYTGSLFSGADENEQAPSLINSIAGAINITQDRITRSRMAGDPPDILLAPKLSNIGLLELYRAGEAIDEGRECVKRMLPEIERLLD